jgi:hypothetical protein
LRQAFAALLIGEQATSALRRALEGETSLEVGRRVKRLLDELGSRKESPPSPELVRLQVIEALEANGTDEARKVLASLAEKDKKRSDKKDKTNGLAPRWERRLKAPSTFTVPCFL